MAVWRDVVAMASGYQAADWTMLRLKSNGWPSRPQSLSSLTDRVNFFVRTHRRAVAMLYGSSKNVRSIEPLYAI
jgi:hypothetical protein